jgi:hypothetical protein
LVANGLQGFSLPGSGARAPVVQSISALAGNRVQVSFAGISNVNYRIDASTNLINWRNLGSAFNTNGAVSFTDATVTNSPMRFYRAVWAP